MNIMNATASKKPILITAWVVILTISLFKIILQEVFKFKVSEDLQLGVEAVIIAAGLILTFLWKDIRPLRAFFGLFAVLVGAQWLVYTKVDQIPLIRSWLNNPSFNIYMLAEQFLNLLVTLIILAYLFIVKRHRREFFLAVGKTSAPAEAVKWLDIKPNESWKPIGLRMAFFISLGTLLFLVIAGQPPLDIVLKAAPFLPAVLLCAAFNAFNEETTYKASFLSVLENVVGKNQALALMAALFGILHFYGVPYGVVGVLMAAFLGWFLGKSMLETRGMFWAWFIHFWQDVLIFAFMAIGSITAGGT